MPARFRGRQLYQHNPNVTLMRTTAEECARDRRASSPTSSTRMEGPVRFLIPEGGVSALDAPGQPFHDPEADRALFDAIEQTLPRRRRPQAASALPLHINDPAFADAAGRRLARAHPHGRAPTRLTSRATMPRIARKTILEKLPRHDRAGRPIIGGGAGTGLSAKCEEAGGIDLIVIYNSGRYRMAGRGSLAGLLAYGNANEIVVRHGARGAAGGEAHAGARRRQRHRSVHDRRRVPAPPDRRSASRASRTFRPSG